MLELALKLKVTDFSSVVVYWLMGSGQQVKIWNTILKLHRRKYEV